MTPTQFTLDAQMVPIGLIDPNPANIRTHLDDLTDLVSSIRSVGVLEPLIGYWVGDRIELIGGHRRHAAGLLAELDELPVVIKDRPDDVVLAEMMLAENTHRAGLDPIDEAHALARIRESGKYRRMEEIAARVHRSKQWVQDRLRLIEGIPEDSWDLVRSGDVSVGDAVELARAKLPAEEKAKLLSLDGDERARRIRVAIDDQRRIARMAKVAEEYGDLLRGADFYHFRDQSPWGLVELGDGPGELNIPVAMHRGACAGHAASIDWDERPHAWCSLPLEHADELGLDVPAKATPLSELGMNAWSIRQAHAEHCPHDRSIDVAGVHQIQVCVDPTIHSNPKRKGYQSIDDLEAAWKTQQGDRRPGEPLRTQDRWTLPPEALDLMHTRMRDLLEPLSPIAAQAIVSCWGAEHELLEISEQLEEGRSAVIEYLVPQLVDDARSTLYQWAHHLENRDPEDLQLLALLEWGLQACVDVGAPPSNLDAIRTRIEVLTKGETADTEEADDA